MKIRIGDLLVKAGVITEVQLRTALAEQQQWGGKLGDILVRMQYVTEEVLVKALAKQTGIPRAVIGDVDMAALARIPPEVAEEYEVVPLEVHDEGKTLVAAMSDPLNLMAIDHLRSITGARIVAKLAGAGEIRSAIARLYQGEELKDEGTEGFRVINNRGETVVGKGTTSAPPARGSPAAQPAPARPPPAAAASAPAPAPAAPRRPGDGSGKSPADLLAALEEMQRKELAALKAMIQLLIEKGVFTREEYLARVRK